MSATLQQLVPTITPDAPWADWREPEVRCAPLQKIKVVMNGEETATRLALQLEDGETERPLIGFASRNALHELSTRVGFPVDFVQKLPLDLQADVINARIIDAREQDFNLIVADEQVTNITPGWRGITPHRLVAQRAHDVICDRLGAAECVRASNLPNAMSLRFLTRTEEPVTRRVGDVLRMGIDVRHVYGMSLEVALYTERLVCTNGMTASQDEFSWSQRTMGSPAEQLTWLGDGINQAVESFGDLIARAQRMAETTFEGNPLQALRERARLLHIPRGQWPALIAAFEEEPGDTEWHLLNAITRFATHTAEAGLGRRLQSLAGGWVNGFDVVTARLPRPVANRIGARIIEEIEALEPAEG